jgi:hypothetical protein
VEVKIGVQDTPRELTLESNQTPEEIRSAVQAALSGGTLLELTDDRGRTLLVPAAKIAYVEIGPSASRRVGFGTPA